VVRCNNVYTGQFDPTLDSTYFLVNELMKLVNSTFEDPYVHFGGDEVTTSCWDLKPSIKAWMAENSIASYHDL
jgi:hexosaminidase